MTDRPAIPPVAKRVPKHLEAHGHTRVDPYYWLNDREDPEVIAYLEAENAYTDAVMAHTEPFQEALFTEIKGRIKQTDMSVPYRMDDYVYYARTVDGHEYPIHCRKRDAANALEEVLIDVNAVAEGHEFTSVGQFAVSSGRDLLAYPVDTVGRRFYTIRFKDLSTGADLDDAIPDATENIAWAEDNRTLFYTKQDPVTLRWNRIYRHTLGTDPADDVLVYEETDETFNAWVFKTRSKGYVVIECQQTLTSEARYVPAGEPEGEWTVFAPRKREHEYSIDHFAGHFYVRTNLEAKNFRLMRAPVDNPDRAQWEEVIAHRDDVLLEGFELYRDHLVVVERKEGLIQIRVRPWAGAGEHYLDFGEPAYLAYPSDNHDLDTTVLRYTYTSMTTPKSVYDYDMVTREKALRKREEVLGGFDSANYCTERLSAPAEDGAAVPVSLVYRKGTALDGSAPLLLYGYGSYGYSMDATFDPNRVSLLDRGFVYAIAHIRGGEELGRQWYEDGKLLKKKNTFTDFIACGENLVGGQYTSPDRLFAMGGSAGGLLMGAVTNMRPDLFRGVVALVPFVDVVTTMFDDSIPLTTSEYDEWGNPNEQASYEYMLSYSPYDNIETKAYPALLVITSLHDSQVQYWEPAKWVAKLRAIKRDGNPLLLRTKMEAGHGGVSGRYKRYREAALVYAFLLDLVGIGK